MTIEDIGEVDVLEVTKVGKCVLHLISKDVPEDVNLIGKKI